MVRPALAHAKYGHASVDDMRHGRTVGTTNDSASRR
jgi:hypothetical protein